MEHTSIATNDADAFDTQTVYYCECCGSYLDIEQFDVYSSLYRTYELGEDFKLYVPEKWYSKVINNLYDAKVILE